MAHNFLGHRGMITEELVNKTIQWYLDNNIAYFRKAFLPLQPTHNSSYGMEGRLLAKADPDYYGVYKGQYIVFEVKETKKNVFSLENLKKHQFQVLKTIHEHGGFSFLMLNFIAYEDEIWMISYNSLCNLIDNKIKSIKYDDIKTFAVKLNIEYPGIVDWIQKLN